MTNDIKFEFLPEKIEERPRVGIEFLEYFEKWMRNEISPYVKNFYKDKLDVHLTFQLLDLNLEEEIFVYPPNRFRKDNIISYSIFIPYKKPENKREILKGLIDVVCKSFRKFIEEEYKKVNWDGVDAAFAKLDKQFLLNLRYPVPFSQQQCTMDSSPQVQDEYFKHYDN